MWPTKKLCIHCNRRNVNRPRGLCWSCWYTPSVLALYPTTSKYGSRGHGLRIVGHQSTDLPTVLTDAEPGTPEKIAVLESRAEQGIALFHPDEPDLRPGGDGARMVTARLRDFPLSIARVLG